MLEQSRKLKVPQQTQIYKIESASWNVHGSVLVTGVEVAVA